jgi:hypothetical protein
VARHLDQPAFKLAGGDVLVDRALGPYDVGLLLREHVDPGERA